MILITREGELYHHIAMIYINMKALNGIPSSCIFDYNKLYRQDLFRVQPYTDLSD